MKPFHFLERLQLIVLCIPLYTIFPHSPFSRFSHLHPLVLWYALSFYCYELVLLGLRIDSTITWNWLYVFIPLYIDEFLLLIHFPLYLWIELGRCLHKKDKQAIFKQISNSSDKDFMKDNISKQVAYLYSD